MARISKSELIRLQKKLKTDDAIGKRYGITRQAVHQLRKKYGIESVVANNAERNKKIVALYKSGKPGTAVAKKFGMSISQAYRIITGAKKAKRKK
jgi:DNA-directed RNA polymerase specialized sigma subunit